MGFNQHPHTDTLLHMHKLSLETHTHTHTNGVEASSLEERRKISHLCVRRVRLEHDCRHQREQTKGRNIQDYQSGEAN